MPKLDLSHRTLISFGQQPAGRGWCSVSDLSVTELPVDPDVFGMSDRGKVRKTNEDQFVIAELNRALVVRHSSYPTPTGECFCDNPQAFVMGVADGVAGVEGGDLASAVALDALCTYALRLLPWARTHAESDELKLDASLEDGVHEAQARMRRVARRKQASERLATTLTLAYVVWPNLYTVHVGHTRAYRMRGNELVRLTDDHTARASDTARPVLLNALNGLGQPIQVDVQESDLMPGDGVLVCSDGLVRHVDDERIASEIAEGRDAESTVSRLIELANEAGGEDNITVTFARF